MIFNIISILFACSEKVCDFSTVNNFFCFQLRMSGAKCAKKFRERREIHARLRFQLSRYAKMQIFGAFWTIIFIPYWAHSFFVRPNNTCVFLVFVTSPQFTMHKSAYTAQKKHNQSGKFNQHYSCSLSQNAALSSLQKRSWFSTQKALLVLLKLSRD